MALNVFEQQQFGIAGVEGVNVTLDTLINRSFQLCLRAIYCAAVVVVVVV